MNSSDGVKATDEKYEMAMLEVNMRYLQFYPEIKSIVEKKDKLKISVQNAFINGARLLMYKDKNDAEPKEVVYVHSWNEDTIVDYLKSHVN